jgi:hypothetical protein
MQSRTIAVLVLILLVIAPAGAAGGDVGGTVRLPGTEFEVIIGRPVLDSKSMRVEPKLLVAMATWLSQDFALPYIDTPPAIAFARPAMIQSMRYENIPLNVGSPAHEDLPLVESEVVAVYHDASQTIYLPIGWTGSTSTELSILVHELVHHLQNLSGMKFACAEEREKLAYEAQRAWLALFGRDFFSDFESDPFTLLVRTQCPL